MNPPPSTDSGDFFSGKTYVLIQKIEIESVKNVVKQGDVVDASSSQSEQSDSAGDTQASTEEGDDEEEDDDEEEKIEAAHNTAVSVHF